MTSVQCAILVAALAFLCGAAGMFVKKRLPEHHVADNTRDLVKLVAGLLATMSALVLSLLISTSAALYNTQSAELQLLSVRVIQLDNILRVYGPDAEPGRILLKNSTIRGYDHIWGAKQDGDFLSAPHANSYTQEITGYLQTLKPADDRQKFLLAKANDLAASITEQRLLMSMQIAAPVVWPLVGILVSWGLILFFGFGILANSNGSVYAALGVGACALASAVFLILELGHPYTGTIRVSPAPLLQAIDAMSR